MGRRRTSPIWKMSSNKFKELVETSDTITEVLAYFGLQNKGRNAHTLKKRFKEEEIDCSRLSKNGRKRRIQAIKNEPISLSEVLVSDSTYNRGRLKKRLVKDGILTPACSICGLGNTWQDKPLTLHLDHKNGDSKDNRLPNLRLLCPNCHSQTKTYAGRSLRKPNGNCEVCGVKINRFNKRGLCVDCANIKRRRIDRPTKEDLEKMVWEKPTIEISKELGVSDSSIGKWCKAMNINKPPRGYWATQRAKKIK